MGFIGTAVARELIDHGHSVLGVARTDEDAMGHFGWLGMFASVDMPATSRVTQEKARVEADARRTDRGHRHGDAAGADDVQLRIRLRPIFASVL